MTMIVSIVPPSKAVNHSSCGANKHDEEKAIACPVVFTEAQYTGEMGGVLTRQLLQPK